MENWQVAERDAMRKLNELFAQKLGFGGGGSSYSYYSPATPRNASRRQDRYMYTTGKVRHKGSLKYVSGIYRYNASKKQWNLLRKAGHAKKKAAIDRARRLSRTNA